MPPTLQRLAWLVVAGSAGTLSRYAVQVCSVRLFGTQYPWGTLGVNILGCFLFGVVWTLAQERDLFAPDTRFILLVGFMGAFTTFSSFAFETVTLARAPGAWLAVVNLLAHNALGILAVVAGIALVRQF